ncbi:DNA primase large subunit PriL [Candidatus Bathyarchaeota archaeon]|nr:DNA primase large subunit PriL [Candidatus Bathyarchaeota archaeon]
MELAVITIEDYAKYPFLKQASSKIQNLDFTIQSIAEDPSILKRAEKRIEAAILDLTTGEPDKDERNEITAYAASLIIAIATKKPWIKKRYALAVAKTAYSDMLKYKNANEKQAKTKIYTIARDFGWNIIDGQKIAGQSVGKDFGVHFANYLKNAAHMHKPEWKLVNQIISNGYIYINKEKAARLLQEEIKSRVEKRLDIDEIKNLPEDINLITNKLNVLAQDIIGQETEEMPKEVTMTAFPPCINALMMEAKQAHHLSHIGRFTLTSFLLNIGMTAEAVNELYKTFSDYNERLTRYQIEHIAGERGSATKYTPPQCSILQTHGVCRNRDELCRYSYHPLKYYKKKIESAKPKANSP